MPEATSSLITTVATSTNVQEASSTQLELKQYIQVTGGCSPSFQGKCLNVRSGPGVEFTVVRQLRNNIVLEVADTVQNDLGETWYKIGFEGGVRYPERLSGGNWYVNADYVRLLEDPGLLIGSKEELRATTTKRIVVNRTKQMLYAYDGETLFMETKISTGLELMPTTRGTFRIFKKLPSRYMQGPQPGIDDYYDLPGVPWTMYFNGGMAIHGAYWHVKFGTQWSHGCVNVPPDEAEVLYKWADMGTLVVVTD